MKKFKRIIASLLVLCMMVGLVPANAMTVDAAGTLVDAAIFCSDVHGNPSTVTSVFNGIKSADSTFNPTTASFVGDTQTTASSVTSAAQEVFSGVQCIYAFGNHDDEETYGIDDFTGLSYGSSSTNYYVYTISENDMSTSSPDTSGFTSTVAGLDKSKPLFIISHMPLHERRNDNYGAAAWYTAISAAAESMDIAFFWAHNHTSESSVDRNAYYVAKNGSETITVEGGSTVTPNFTYLNAGYIDPPNNDAQRLNVATGVRIYDNSINYTVYNASGELSGTYAVNETVTRQFANTEVTLSSIAVTTEPTKTTYNVGDTFSADGMVITATYSDGSTKTITGYSLSTVDMSTAGTKTVTVTYTEGDVTKTATFDITVNEVISESATVTAINVETEKTEYVLGESLSKDDLVVTATYNDNGTTKTKTLLSDEYTVTAPDMTTEGTKTVTVSYTYNNTTVTEEYEITVTEADSNEVTVGGKVTTTETKTVYVLTSSISSGNSYLIANSALAGSVNLVANDGGDLSNTSSTVVYGDCDGDGDSEYYIELDNATDELWTASGSDSSTFKNQDEYLRCGNGNLSVSSQSTTWTYSNNRLSYTSQSSSGGSNRPEQGGSSSTTYYLRYNEGWTVTRNSSEASNIYFYVPTEVEVETTVDTTVKYTMYAEDLEKVVEEGSTAELVYYLQGNGSELTTLPSGGNYSFTVLSDEDKIIESIDSDGTITFTGVVGDAKVKVAYTWTQDGQTHTVYKNVTVKASEPYYTIDITDGTKGTTEENEDGTTTTTYPSVTNTIALKGITAGQTYDLNHVLTLVSVDGETVDTISTVTWTSSDESIASVDEKGLVTLKGVTGSVNITVSYEVSEGHYVTDTITISANTSSYTTPSDGTSDFPEYPNEGAIRYDKTATAVGNFSETGIAQVELSMTGVPYSTGSEMDVVVMLDMSTSMDDDRIAATVAATKVFVESIVKNEDGSYNSNRIYVGYFNGDTVYTITDSGNIGGELATVDNDTEYNALISAIEDEYDGALTASGTNYDVSLEKCYNVLTTAKTDGTGNDRQQFCVFMSDGGPTDYATSASNVVSESTVVSWFDVSASDSTNWKNSMVEEYWSGLMKDNGVTIYSVGLILQEQPTSGPQDYRSYSADQNYYVTSTLLTGISSGDDYFYNVESATDTADMENVFSEIAQKILQAATDVTVEDQITDEYTMIFDIPEGSIDITGVTNDFYIEFLKYTLDKNHERPDTYTSVTKLYLKNTDGVYSAASDSSGTAYASPVFENTTLGDKGTLYYWTTDDTVKNSGVSVIVDGTTYYFVPYGMKATDTNYDSTKWFNMTSGAYAYGTVDSKTNMSDDLIIVTPYFVYNASTKMLYWTVEKLDTEEYALRYFLYLDNSATEVGTDAEVDAATYPTNDHAYITYTNFNGTECQQKFPVPQLTWNGAQVSYVFYLVNSAGQPINKAGQVVDFANATFVTDTYTKAVVWNKGTDGQIIGDGDLSINWLADNLLPDSYTVYDESASYKLQVYADNTGTSIFNHFTIGGADSITISNSLNERLSLKTTADTVSVETTKVYNTKAGTKYDDYGTYTSKVTDSIDNETVLTGFDFANTTVAFAVVWEPRLVPDTVVVDYGLPVVINVVQNDMLQNTVSGIGLGNEAYGSTAMNTGVVPESKLGTATLTTAGGSTISIENENTVRFKQNDMSFAEKEVFYYESPVEFYEGSEKESGYMYSSVTVIPATTIYYEDNFVNFTSYTKQTTTNEDGTTSSAYVQDTKSKWTIDGTVNTTATQAQDRPGASQISNDIDADNNYGYDNAYANSSLHSLGSAHKIDVTSDVRGEATFSFYGTGFDIVGLTSNTTGTLIVQVYSGATASGTAVKTSIIDTYYGYAYGDNDGDGEKEWYTVDSNSPNALYQVPVMKISDLPYGQYTVKLIAGYNSSFDHTSDENGDYTLYVDAIRIYDPANDGTSDEVIKNTYITDNEAYPEYTELRDEIITAETFNALEGDTTVSGIVFIDGATTDPDREVSIADYTAYGPNNEVYLQYGQAVAFDLNATATAGEVVSIQLAVKSVGGTGAVEVYGVDANGNETACLAETISTATDMYYDITSLNGQTVVIKNTGTADTEATISLTNIKTTYTAEQISTEEDTEATGYSLLSVRRSTGDVAVMSLSVEEPTVFVPETFEVSINKSKVKVSDKVKVTVTTSEEVEYITVNAEVIDDYKIDKKTGLKTWKTQLKATEVGELSIEVVAYSEDDIASDTLTETVTVTHKNNKGKKGR